MFVLRTKRRIMYIRASMYKLSHAHGGKEFYFSIMEKTLSAGQVYELDFDPQENEGTRNQGTYAAPYLCA